MLSVIILDNGERNVVQFTYEHLYRELKDIPGSELKISENWFDGLESIKNKYVCFVEPDCLVNSGYFTSQMGLFEKNKYLRKLAMLSSAVAVSAWHNKFFGYSLSKEFEGNVEPQHDKHSSSVYALEIGYLPGSIIRKSMLMPVLENLELATNFTDDLVLLSTQVSLAFWGQGDGNRVHINPNTAYCTTEDYVNDIGKFKDIIEVSDKIQSIFKKESI